MDQSKTAAQTKAMQKMQTLKEEQNSKTVEKVVTSIQAKSVSQVDQAVPEIKKFNGVNLDELSDDLSTQNVNKEIIKELNKDVSKE